MTTVVRGADALWGWSRQLWDPSRGLVANPPGGYAELGPFAGRHLIRETAWFAFDALAHGEPAVAAAALNTVLDRQYDRPDRPWHGTFPIFEHDPEPGDDAIMWLSYDPNWRQFVGVALALIVSEHSSLLPAHLVARCEAAVRRCVEGEPPGRIPATYTNPALMHAWLCDWAGRRVGEPSMSSRGQALASEVMARFDETGTLSEFNSPTYDGVNLMAATLWAAAAEPLRGWGRRLVDSLVDSLAFLYHPGLRNLCGPYSRAYGMDLGSRVTLYGLWRLVARDEPSALPPLGEGPVEHSHDLFFAPLVDWALRHLPRPFPADDRAFPRRRRFALSEGRSAVAYLRPDVMIGAERGGRAASAGLVWDQYAPGTMHWLGEGSRVCWLRVHATPSEPVDCELLAGALLVDGAGATVVMTTNAQVEWRGAGELRLAGRVQVQAPATVEVEECAAGLRLVVREAASPVVLRP